MRWILFILAAVVIVLVQAAWLARLGDVARLLDVTLLFAIYLGAHAGPVRTVLACWMLGLLRDVFSSTPLGFWAAVFVVVGALAFEVRRRFFLDKPPVQAVVCFLAVSLACLASFSLQPTAYSLQPIASKVVLSGALSAAVSFPLFWLLRKARFAVGIVERT